MSDTSLCLSGIINWPAVYTFSIVIYPYMHSASALIHHCSTPRVPNKGPSNVPFIHHLYLCNVSHCLSACHGGQPCCLNIQLYEHLCVRAYECEWTCGCARVCARACVCVCVSVCACVCVCARGSSMR